MFRTLIQSIAPSLEGRPSRCVWTSAHLRLNQRAAVDDVKSQATMEHLSKRGLAIPYVPRQDND